MTTTATSSVPFVDLAAQQAEILAEIRPEIDRILTTAAFVGGPGVAAFEAEFAEFSQVRHCVGVANGTDALELAYRAVGIEPGQEILMPANTFVATAGAAARMGARPTFSDVDEATLLMDPASVADVITQGTAAVVPVHLYGQAAPVEQIEPVATARGAVLVEDGAQSQGATRHGRAAGSLGAIAATSFYPGKNLGAAGDAGAVTTDDEDLARQVRLLANHGSEEKYVHRVAGFNSRMDAIQAVVLRAKLARLGRWNELRRRAAERYAELLSDIDEVTLPGSLPGSTHVWHLYVVRLPDRDRVLRSLHEAGIGAALHYPEPVHLTEAFRHLGYARGDFPVAERAAAELLSLPMYPHIAPEHQVRVADALREACGSR
ncbi:MAG: DegT/DnrJ/EryC1/StrS family aminotransferase [Georgenia sp.]